MVSQQQMPDVFAKLIHDYIRPRTQRWSVVIMGMPTKYFIDIDKATEHFENECVLVDAWFVELYEEKLTANKWDMILVEAYEITQCDCCGCDVEKQKEGQFDWEWINGSVECRRCDDIVCADCLGDEELCLECCDSSNEDED